MDEQSGNGRDAIPGLELAWALHAQGDAPEPKQGLSVRRIVAAAVEVADTEGLGAVSMSRVAKSLGFTTMSLYRHVRSKEELLLLMQDAAVGPPVEFDRTAPAQWRAGLETWAWAVVGAFRRHPWIMATIPMFGPPATPYQLSWLERGLRMLAGTGLTEGEKVSAILMLDAQVFGDLFFAGVDEPVVGEGEEDPYVAMFTRVLDPAQFPALMAAVEGGAFLSTGDAAAERDALFAFGLARALDGIERLIEVRGAGGDGGGDAGGAGGAHGEAAGSAAGSAV